MRRSSFLDRAGVRSVLASLIAILIGMLVGGVIILIVGLSGAWRGGSPMNRTMRL